MSFVKDKMFVIPAVDIKDGNCVQLVQGKPGTEMVKIPNPELVALDWENQGAEILHIIDLDGAIHDKTNLMAIKNILHEVSVPIQLGGGIRSIDYAKTLLDLDINRIIIGTMGIKNPEIITELSDEYGSDRIMISLDSKDNKVLIKGWAENIDKNPSQLSKEFEVAGAGSILFTNVDVEGLINGFYINPLIELLNSTKLPIVYSGGVSSIEDLKELKRSKVNGVVIGSALYKNKIEFKEALKTK
ncbi:1-(5-phosphoribosyl)-5-[(5-phosphoribosylamino)methylideneamino]imidazole-4-carboxamide isomerase [Methanobrevibacter curvatus]|uniref:1-(5-phosphoribosyl)-5-[(5-phosphoribosylamino)methylideneamino] imidazole-4-carboxamide isomerase n=1 Tax=Methanobrevibacter curvatus TaxID=49547 RepID=A0A166AR66_9EURY|nr:1-(5-phosphoribosyl)-5-[(5-phosphoribosylamino)methylideneamino]imidazole-4-carboxamide isomerase [Methanobrevibacter curvatus]KZX12371.1 1-(5-phosphoribosyl)-5-[(5-phosphoribosylamino)methylideneamino] imidazole-4-carboxamide isomerase [Methanobrevibacter curvatus]